MVQVVIREAGAVSLPGDGSSLIIKAILPPILIGKAAGRPAAGIAMRLDPECDVFHLILLDAANGALLALGPFGEDEVVAEWRALAAATGLELKIQLPNGAILSPYPQIGRVFLGPLRQRRRHGLLARRRPRFLTRRKVGSVPLRPPVHREDELADRGEG